MAFDTKGLTELGPYGVPISITLPLFSDGTPLRAVLAQGFIARTCDQAGMLFLSHEQTGRFCRMMLGPGDTLWNIEEDSLHAFEDVESGGISLTHIGSTMQNRNVRVTEQMAVVDFHTDLIITSIPMNISPLSVVEVEGIINLLDLEATN